MKPEAPGHHNTEPAGSAGQADPTKTVTDPQTGAPSKGRPDTAGA